jgi:protein-L-isoaspartate(D-aspartate) O-methyltransferase
MGELDAVRRFYAEEVAAVAHLEPGALVDAFARVERERFLGPGPWLIMRDPMRPGLEAYRRTPDADPRHIYHNVLVGIDPARKLKTASRAGWRCGSPRSRCGRATAWSTSAAASAITPRSSPS